MSWYVWVILALVAIAAIVLLVYSLWRLAMLSAAPSYAMFGARPEKKKTDKAPRDN